MRWNKVRDVIRLLSDKYTVMKDKSNYRPWEFFLQISSSGGVYALHEREYEVKLGHLVYEVLPEIESY